MQRRAAAAAASSSSSHPPPPPYPNSSDGCGIDGDRRRRFHHHHHHHDDDEIAHHEEEEKKNRTNGCNGVDDGNGNGNGKSNGLTGRKQRRDSHHNYHPNQNHPNGGGVMMAPTSASTITTATLPATTTTLPETAAITTTTPPSYGNCCNGNNNNNNTNSNNTTNSNTTTNGGGGGGGGGGGSCRSSRGGVGGTGPTTGPYHPRHQHGNRNGHTRHRQKQQSPKHAQASYRTNFSQSRHAGHHPGHHHKIHPMHSNAARKLAVAAEEADFRELVQFGLMLGAILGCGLWALLSVVSYAADQGTELLLSNIIPSRRIVYRIPDAMSHIGDKTLDYQLLRKDIDAVLPKDPARSLQAAEGIRKHNYTPIDDAAPYDFLNCPEYPPEHYPFSYNILNVLDHWPPDDPTPRSRIHLTLCRFDYNRDYDKALVYRSMELPFVVRHDPAVAQAVERWNHPGYMQRLMNTVPHRAEKSNSNHFLYWLAPPGEPKNPKVAAKARLRPHPKRDWRNQIEKPANWSQPTQLLRMTYKEWFQKANVSDDFLGPDQPHWYYRLIGCGDPPHCDRGSSEYLFDELTFFQPKPDQLYLVDPNAQRGIHCRFGMKGVIAENHFDGSRNAIVVLGGERRYILAHPDQCPKLALYPKEHPSARHSAVDWSEVDADDPRLDEEFPLFRQARVTEVVLQAGDVLYLPTNWFHYIISLDLNFQCNTRSGISQETMDVIKQCGF